MSRFHFHHYDDDGRSLTYTTDAIVLDKILDDFTNFLRGCGYQLDGLETTWDEDLHTNKN